MNQDKKQHRYHVTAKLKSICTGFAFSLCSLRFDVFHVISGLSPVVVNMMTTRSLHGR